MGQSASKAARKVAGGATNKASSARRGVVADDGSSFTRGQGQITAHDQRQKDLFLNLRQDQSKQQQQSDKMPDDLLKFIQDIGPLKKREIQLLAKKKDSATTSSTDSPSDHQEQPSSRPSSDRITHKMPLKQGVPGFETLKTTSFSHRTDDSSSSTSADFRLDIVDIYRWLDLQRQSQTTADDFMAQSSNSTATTTTSTTNEQLTKNRQLRLEQTRQALELPVVLEDQNQDFIAVPPSRVEDVLRFHRDMKLSSQVTLVLQDLSENEKNV